MKKLLILVLAVLMTVSLFAACAKTDTTDTPADTTATDKPADTTATDKPADTTATDAPTEAEGYEIAMITDKGDIDDKSFNQGTWEGIAEYAEANGITHKYYKPTDFATDAYIAAIDLAVQGGAKIIVTPGYMFEPAIFVAQDTHPDVKFILIDGFPNNWSSDDYQEKTGDNVWGVKYMEEQVGFLAGYAAVKEGFTKLGYLGGQAVPAVMKYGYGFIQGADYAAKEMGITVDMMYHYTGDFAATPENQAKAAAWYSSGTECIFAAGGKVGNSAMAAAEAAAGTAWVIGVDVDQSGDSVKVIDSAMKALAGKTQEGLDAFYNGTFPGGTNETVGIAEDGVSLQMTNSRWSVFTQADYDALVAALIADTDGIASGILDDKAGAEPTDIPVTNVNLTVD